MEEIALEIASLDSSSEGLKMAKPVEALSQGEGGEIGERFPNSLGMVCFAVLEGVQRFWKVWEG